MNKKSLSLILVVAGTALICTYFIMPKNNMSDGTKVNQGNSSVSNVLDNSSNKENNDKIDNKDNLPATPNAYREQVSPVNSDALSENLTLENYIKTLDCIDYTVKEGDTLNSISQNYTNHCSLYTVKYLISLVNNLQSDDLKVGTTLKIPEDTINNGSLHKIVKNDTWYKLTNEYYKNYKVEDIENLVSKLNNMNDTTLVLDKTVFLPSIQ